MPTNPFAIGLGSRKFQPDNEPLHNCEERIVPGCGCCGVAPCVLCLSWFPDDDETAVQWGTAPGDGLEWIGTVAGISFRAYWNAYDCRIVVEADGNEVWSAVLCSYDGVTCRNFDGEVAYNDGTLRWERKTVLETKRRKGSQDIYSESKCAQSFCGDHCDCLCERLCMSIGNLNSELDCTGIIEFNGTFCETGKVETASWADDIDCGDDETVAVEVKLGRDDYTGECVLFGTAVGTGFSLSLPPTEISDCKELGATWTVDIGGEEYTVTVRCEQCGECDPGICLICCDSVPPYPPSEMVCRITLGTIVQPDPPEPPFSTACWTDLEFPISFLHDVDEDQSGACEGHGTTRRADCISNTLDGEFNPDCCVGGQWVGSGSNACGEIAVCFVPCATHPCPPDTETETWTAWDLHVAVGGGYCDAVGQCLICHDEIAFSAEGLQVCGGVLFTPGTGTAQLVVDISET